MAEAKTGAGREKRAGGRAPGSPESGEARKTKASAGPLPLAPGDRLKLKKPHPCGGAEFEVVRTGMDIRLQCLTCGSQILLPRRRLEKMIDRKSHHRV